MAWSLPYFLGLMIACVLKEERTRNNSEEIVSHTLSYKFASHVAKECRIM